MKPSIRAVLESKDIATHHAPSPAELAARASEKCSSCPHQYMPAPGADPADHRCGECKAKARLQAADAEVSIHCEWSSLHGLWGLGRQVTVPEPGWAVRLYMDPGRELFFGAEAVRVERQLQALPEPRLPLPGEAWKAKSGES